MVANRENRTSRRWFVALAVAAAIPAAFFAGLERLQVETDISRSLPGQDPILEAASRIAGRHPALDRVIIDLHLAGEPDPDRLAVAAVALEEHLRTSGVFRRVGLAEARDAFPSLVAQVTESLPLAFDTLALESQVAPRLTPEAVRIALERDLAELSDFSGFGQADLLARDPLRLSELVLSRLAGARPAAGAKLYRGALLDAEARHALVLAEPDGRGSDTALGRRVQTAIDRARADLATQEPGVQVEAIGSFRAAVDNEDIVRADTERALWIATLGIALLLLLCFPRPLLGLLALLPSLAGASLALLTYSLFYRSISALALGFGGALIAITVDCSVAFLLKLDRDRATSGREVAREMWAPSLSAMLTTVGAFLALGLSGFEMLTQIGLFASLGAFYSWLFVEGVFPLLFPRLGPARRGSLLPVERWLTELTTRRSFAAFGLALAVAAAALLVGPPAIQADLAALNTVRPETAAAEGRVQAVWGDLGKKVHLLVEAENPEDLRERLDRLAPALAAARAAGQIDHSFTPGDILPGAGQARRNLLAWRAFFDPARRAALAETLGQAGAALGFAADAFAPFLASLERTEARPEPLDPAVASLLGVQLQADGPANWAGLVTPGPNYDAEAFAALVLPEAALFEGGLFSQHLSDRIRDVYLRLFAIMGAAIGLLLLLVLWDFWLFAAALLPTAFTFAVTGGLLRLLNHPLDVSGLLLLAVVLGVGVDYAVFYLKGVQRTSDEAHPSIGPIRVMVLLSGGSTLIGMLSMLASKHAVPHSAGLTTSIGIAAALVGTFTLLPPLLGRLFRRPAFPAEPLEPGSARHLRAVRARYRRLEPYPRLFARFKLALDPMFPRLDSLVGPAERVLDVGAGYGVPAVFLLAARPDLEIVGLEPDPERARVAALAVGDRGRVFAAAAPDLAAASGPFDAALLLDVVHHLDDPALSLTLRGLRERLAPGGRLVVRATLPSRGFAWERALEVLRLRLGGRQIHLRPEADLRRALTAAGFQVELVEPAAPGREETWLSATP